MNDHEFLTVPEVAKLLRISRNLVYELVAQGVLPSIRLGRRILVPRDLLDQQIRRQRREDAHEHAA